MLTYKVVEVRQKSFMKGVMTAADLQNAINTWANIGWTLDRISSGETQGFLGGKDVFLLIFKKEISVPENLFLMIDNQSVLVTELILTQIKASRKVTSATVAYFKGMADWEPLFRIAPEVYEFLTN